MALFGFTKRKKAAAKTPSPSASTLAPRPAPSEASSPRADAARVPGKSIPGILIAPHITEKATSGARHGWYVFRVAKNADKPTIKRAVEARYGVRVLRVRVVNRRPRPIRLGRTEGKVSGFKNAMVRVAEGQSIEFA